MSTNSARSTRPSQILRAALIGPAAGRSRWTRLAAMPDTGDDVDFERVGDAPREVDL